MQSNLVRGTDETSAIGAAFGDGGLRLEVVLGDFWLGIFEVVAVFVVARCAIGFIRWRFCGYGWGSCAIGIFLGRIVRLELFDVVWRWVGGFSSFSAAESGVLGIFAPGKLFITCN